MKTQTVLLVLILLGGTGAPYHAHAQITGQDVPELAAFDQLIPPLLDQYHVPGAAVAVAYQGRLVFARGYGLADTTAGTPVQPYDLFRIASISKPITAVAVARLIEEGRLSLDDTVFVDHLGDLTPLPGETADPRLYDITVRDLLYHMGGWDRDQSGDPMFLPFQIAQAAGVDAPPSRETIARYVMGRPLDFTPGTRNAYSNFGYLLLGRVIERVTGQSYAAYVDTLLAQAGVDRFAQGRSRVEEHLDHEVRYYMQPGTSQATSVFTQEPVPWPYGGFYLEAMDAHGGWVTTTVDLLRFATAVDGLPSRPDILEAETVQTMFAVPQGTPAADPDNNPATGWYQGMGWSMNPFGNERIFWHNGSLPGTSTILVNRTDGVSWVALANARANNGTFLPALDNTLWTAINSVEQWPAHDLFEAFDPPPPAGTPTQETPDAPPAFALPRNYPNPFRSTTTVRFELPVAGAVRLAVYDLLGREVALLIDRVLPAGTHEAVFEAAGLPAGVYASRLDAAGRTRTRTMVMLK